MVKVKRGKNHPGTGHEGPVWEKRCNSTFSLTSALGWSAWSTPRPGRFNPGKETRYLSYRRLGGPQGRSGRVRKISPLPCTDPRTVQSVASRYTDYTIPAPRTFMERCLWAKAHFPSYTIFKVLIAVYKNCFFLEYDAVQTLRL